MGSGFVPSNEREVSSGDFTLSVEALLDARGKLGRFINARSSDDWINCNSEQVKRGPWTMQPDGRLLRFIGIAMDSPGRVVVIQFGIPSVQGKANAIEAIIEPSDIVYLQTNKRQIGGRLVRHEVWLDGKIATFSSTIVVEADGSERVYARVPARPEFTYYIAVKLIRDITSRFKPFDTSSRRRSSRGGG